MHIANIIFSDTASGITQSFADYCEGLHKRGHRITAITPPMAGLTADLATLGIDAVTMRSFGEWDMLAQQKLRRILESVKPDIIIAHTPRAYALAKSASKNIPVVGNVHNNSRGTQRMAGAAGVFATTHNLMDVMMRHGVPQTQIFHVPDMVRCDALPIRDARSRFQPPVIGTMGRFVKNKGFDIYIDALAILKQRKYHFKATLGGVGPEASRLKQQAHAAGLKDVLQFPGWVADKRAFYTGIDIFCLPSLYEPFGIILLEAFVSGVPVVAADSEGPHDIITPNFDALAVPIADPQAMAEGMAKLLDDVQLSYTLATNAFVKAKTAYSIESVAARIEKDLETILKQAKA